MGCDIHLKLEYRVKEEFIPSDLNDYSSDKLISLTDSYKKGEINNEEYEEIRDKIYKYLYLKIYNTWRDTYFWDEKTWGNRHCGMFAKLANVRNYWGDEIKPLEVRGFPEDASPGTYSEYCYTIIDDDKWCDFMNGDGLYVKRSEVENLIKKYDEKVYKIGNQEFLTCCDYHSASWCTTQEMEMAINEIFKDTDDLNVDFLRWMALLGVMKGFESNGKFECRAVFWFDN